MHSTSKYMFQTVLIECRVDVVFCLDNSASIGNYKPGKTNPNWERILQFVQDLVGQLNVGPSQTHVGVVDYGKQSLLNIK